MARAGGSPASPSRCCAGPGLFDPLIYLQTGGRRYKWSEGDGLYYSYSLFDDLSAVTTKFPRLFMLNTLPCAGTDLRRNRPAQRQPRRNDPGAALIAPGR